MIDTRRTINHFCCSKKGFIFMEITQENLNGVLILKLNGRLDITTTQQLEVAINSALEKEQKKILVDCTNLEYISSAGLRTLLAAAKNSKKIDGIISLCCLNKNVKQIFEISGFTAIFDIFDSIENAITSL